jgi:hypothetical protein
MCRISHNYGGYRKKIAIITTTFLFLTLMGCSSKLDPIEKLIGSYHTKGAGLAEITSYGRMTEDGAFWKNETPNWEKVKSRIVSIVEIKKEELEELEEAGINISELAKVQYGSATTSKNSYYIVLLDTSEIATLQRELSKIMIDDAVVKQHMQNSDVRIVTTVGLVFNHTSINKIKNWINANLTLRRNDNWSLGIYGKKQGREQLIFSIT